MYIFFPDTVDLTDGIMKIDLVFLVIQLVFGVLVVFGAFLAVRKAAWEEKEWKGSVETKLEDLKNLAEEISSDIKKIFEKLQTSAVSKQDPVKLTNTDRKASQKQS